MATIEDLADRVERLLLRHQELQRTNALLTTQLGAVTSERDNLALATERRPQPHRRAAAAPAARTPAADRRRRDAAGESEPLRSVG